MGFFGDSLANSQTNQLGIVADLLSNKKAIDQRKSETLVNSISNAVRVLSDNRQNKANNEAAITLQTQRDAEALKRQELQTNAQLENQRSNREAIQNRFNIERKDALERSKQAREDKKLDELSLGNAIDQFTKFVSLSKEGVLDQNTMKAMSQALVDKFDDNEGLQKQFLSVANSQFQNDPIQPRSIREQELTIEPNQLLQEISGRFPVNPTQNPTQPLIDNVRLKGAVQSNVQNLPTNAQEAEVLSTRGVLDFGKLQEQLDLEQEQKQADLDLDLASVQKKKADVVSSQQKAKANLPSATFSGNKGRLQSTITGEELIAETNNQLKADVTSYNNLPLSERLKREGKQLEAVDKGQLATTNLDSLFSTMQSLDLKYDSSVLTSAAETLSEIVRNPALEEEVILDRFTTAGLSEEESRLLLAAQNFAKATPASFIKGVVGDSGNVNEGEGQRALSASSIFAGNSFEQALMNIAYASSIVNETLANRLISVAKVENANAFIERANDVNSFLGKNPYGYKTRPVFFNKKPTTTTEDKKSSTTDFSEFD